MQKLLLLLLENLQGLGNQMSMIAATISTVLDHGATPIFPDLLTRTCDNMPLNYQKVPPQGK